MKDYRYRLRTIEFERKYFHKHRFRFGQSLLAVMAMVVGGTYAAYLLQNPDRAIKQDPQRIDIPIPSSWPDEAELDERSHQVPFTMYTTIMQSPLLSSPLQQLALQFERKTVQPDLDFTLIDGDAPITVAADSTFEDDTPLIQGPKTIEYQIQAGDTLGSIFQAHGLGAQQLHNILATLKPEQSRRLARIRPGEQLTLELDENLAFAALRFELDVVRTLHIEQTEKKLASRIEQATVELQQRRLTAVVESSLYQAAQKSGIPRSITNSAIDLFRSRINFARRIRPGDRVTVIFEQQWANDQPIDDGRLLAVEIVNNNQVHSAVRYTTRDGQTDFYTPDAEPVHIERYAFLRAPLNYTRISSGFSTNRWHPILRRRRPHTGVDFAAPEGRPVVASANGRVLFRGVKGGYGNTVILSHGSKYKTLYAHLSRFGDNVSVGQAVDRNQVIGYVGQTGMATGPHLHYELHVNNQPVDPMTASLPFIHPLSDEEQARFRRTVRPMLAALSEHDTDSLVAATRQRNNNQADN